MSIVDAGDDLVDVGRGVERDGVEKAFMLVFSGSSIIE